VITTRIEPLANFINVAVADMQPAAQKAAIAIFARQQLDEAQAINRRAIGRVPPHRTAVDGRLGAPLESVNPKGGVINFEFELVGEVLAWILSELRRRSPVASGAYRAGHRLFADGQEIEAVGATGIVPRAASEYTLTNLQPYARKLEIGRTKSGRAFLISVPNKIYQRTATDASRRFGNIARIRFSYRSPSLPYGGRASRRGGAERASRAPAIIVVPR
jgi:hypothetical protein